ncbi:hypothetical protein BD309DRAFT_1016844 [Dichomitus squalens]|uniref:Uncharacterized protein n=1 Tax=Dichomitus squalens TaxID=114155 RepID=A0A4V2K527_9APHY|nr:hypothetical protein BD309DRAFT_1016844 [Dichomitus squalens]TBU60511.1 hypothetical protein BD310DRAFT_975792 [Dichomitus squalens]
MVSKKSRKVKAYGEKGAILDDFRQKHRPPTSLRQAIGDDNEVMNVCPVYGLPFSHEPPQTLSEKAKEAYKRRKERERKPKMAQAEGLPNDVGSDGESGRWVYWSQDEQERRSDEPTRHPIAGSPTSLEMGHASMASRPMFSEPVNASSRFAIGLYGTLYDPPVIPQPPSPGIGHATMAFSPSCLLLSSLPKAGYQLVWTFNAVRLAVAKE